MRATETLETLIDQAQKLDPKAFDELVDIYAPRLYGFLYRLTGQPDEADDLVQEVFVRVVQRIDRYVHDGRFEAWLFRIATNLARDRIRRIKRRPTPLSGDHGSASDEGLSGGAIWDQIQDRDHPTGPSMEQREDVDRLQMALVQLPDSEREVIMLRHYSDMTFSEIAEMMGTPLGTALARSHRALGKLRTLMEEGEA